MPGYQAHDTVLVDILNVCHGRDDILPPRVAQDDLGQHGKVCVHQQVQVSAERIMEVLARERLSRPLTDAACFAIFRDEFIGDDALIFLCGAISVAATDIV